MIYFMNKSYAYLSEFFYSALLFRLTRFLALHFMYTNNSNLPLSVNNPSHQTLSKSLTAMPVTISNNNAPLASILHELVACAFKCLHNGMPPQVTSSVQIKRRESNLMVN